MGFALANSSAGAETPACTMTPLDEWPVRLVHGKLVAEGTVNGQKVGMMVDTGWPRTLVFRAAVPRLGLDPAWSSRIHMIDMGGETDVDTAVVKEFELGRAKRKDWQMYVAGERDPGDNVAVLLGDDLLHKVDVEFDLGHNAVRLLAFRGCSGSLAYWAAADSTVSAVGIAPVDDARPQVLLPVRINGRPVIALLDSGAASSVLDKAVAASVGIEPETPGVAPAGSVMSILGNTPVPVWLGSFQSFEVGSERVSDAKILFGDVWQETRLAMARAHNHSPIPLSRYPAMVLGVDFLLAHRVLIAHSQQRIYFTSAGGQMLEPGSAVSNGNGTPAGPTK
jgi:predicted aspartyl protease